MNSGAQVRTDHLIRLLGIYYHLTYRVFVWFSLICSRGGGARQRQQAVTLDTVADESRKKMAYDVARSPSRLCSRDGNDLLLWRRLEYDFLASFSCALLPTFFLFTFLSFLLSFLHPGVFIFVSLRLCSSHLLLLSFVPYPISDLFCFFILLLIERYKFSILWSQTGHKQWTIKNQTLKNQSRQIKC